MCYRIIKSLCCLVMLQVKVWSVNDFTALKHTAQICLCRFSQLGATKTILSTSNNTLVECMKYVFFLHARSKIFMEQTYMGTSINTRHNIARLLTKDADFCSSFLFTSMFPVQMMQTNPLCKDERLSEEAEDTHVQFSFEYLFLSRTYGLKWDENNAYIY